MDRRKFKAQAGVETLIAIIILLLIFSITFSLFAQRGAETEWSKDWLDAKKECYRISALIGRVRSNGFGFSEQSSFSDFKVTVFGDMRSILVEWDGKSSYCTFSTANVTNVTHNSFGLFGKYKVVNDGINVSFQKM